jgi:hypothetical protein
MGFFMPDSDARAGYFGSADLSGLNDLDLFGPMPFGIPPAAIRSAFGAPEEARSRPNPDTFEIAGGPPCQGPYCQSGGSYGTTGMYGIGQPPVPMCRDCAVKVEGLGGLPGAVQAEKLAPFLIEGGGNPGGNPKFPLWKQRIQRRN